MKQDALVEAFTLFSEESKKLEKSYLALQKEVKEKSNDLSEIVSHLAEGLIFVTLQGKISFFNYAAEKITQVSSGQAFNQLYSSFFSDSAFGFSMEEALQACQINKKIYLTFGNGKEISVSAS